VSLAIGLGSGMLIKTQRVLKLKRIIQPQSLEGGSVVFTAVETIPGDEVAVIMDFDVWKDMDRPEYITVAIEPGDSLNANP
jgi:hypothetical protein